MTLTESGAFPADFIHLGLFFAFAIYSLSLQLQWQDFRTVLTSRQSLIWGLASQLILLPLLLFTAMFAFQLSLENGTGLMLAGAMPTLAFAALLTWYARGNVPLAIVLVSLTSLFSTLWTPGLISLWTQLHPLAASDAQLLDYTPIYALASFLGVTVLPISIALICRRLFPRQCAWVAPALIKLSLAIAMLIPVALIGSNLERLTGSYTNIGPLVLLVYAAIAYFIFALMRSLKLPSSEVRAITLSTVTQNIAIAGILTISGLGVASEHALTIMWWGIAQYFGGFLVAHTLRGRSD